MTRKSAADSVNSVKVMTELNPINCHDEMTGLVDKGRAVDIANLDFSKAFDPVSCKSLLNEQLTKELDAQTVRKRLQEGPEGGDVWNKSGYRSVTSSAPGTLGTNLI